MRTCDNVSTVNDCETANSVIYCICNTNLCNQKKMITIRTDMKQKSEKKRRRPENPVSTTDDEDLAESSGMGEHNYSGERKKVWTNNIEKPKQIMQITLKPATEALNLTTTSPSLSNNAKTFKDKTFLLFTLVFLGNLIVFTRRESFTRINI